jgi:hypothetical protein
LGNRRFPRGDAYGSALRKVDLNRFKLLDADDGHEGPKLVLTDRMRQEFKQGKVSLQAKFEVFQQGIEKNPKILEALLRRRFSLVRFKK